jgi:hypothetical protein
VTSPEQVLIVQTHGTTGATENPKFVQCNCFIPCLNVFENRVLRIFGNNMEEVTGGWEQTA